jgi:hypothetical protein
MIHYRMTLDEHIAVRGSYVDPQRYQVYDRDYKPEMLCRTGDGHATGTRSKDSVTCDRCLVALQK